MTELTAHIQVMEQKVALFQRHVGWYEHSLRTISTTADDLVAPYEDELVTTIRTGLPGDIRSIEQTRDTIYDLYVESLTAGEPIRSKVRPDRPASNDVPASIMRALDVVVPPRGFLTDWEPDLDYSLAAIHRLDAVEEQYYRALERLNRYEPVIADAYGESINSYTPLEPQ